MNSPLARQSSLAVEPYPENHKGMGTHILSMMISGSKNTVDGGSKPFPNNDQCLLGNQELGGQVQQHHTHTLVSMAVAIFFGAFVLWVLFLSSSPAPVPFEEAFVFSSALAEPPLVSYKTRAHESRHQNEIQGKHPERERETRENSCQSTNNNPGQRKNRQVALFRAEVETQDDRSRDLGFFGHQITMTSTCFVPLGFPSRPHVSHSWVASAVF